MRESVGIEIPRDLGGSTMDRNSMRGDGWYYEMQLHCTIYLKDRHGDVEM
jgi:hypothetical protein